MRKVTQEDFIKRAKAIHGDKYDYSKVVYKTNREKVIIMMNGKEYEQIPYNHLRGYRPELVNPKKPRPELDLYRWL